jgi:hypothetical protein
MNPLDRLARELARLGSHLLRIDPALHHSPTSDVEHDGPDAAFDSLPIDTDQRRNEVLSETIERLRAEGKPIDGDLIAAIVHAAQQTPEDVTAEWAAMTRAGADDADDFGEGCGR